MPKTDPLISKTTRLTRRAWAFLFWERYAPVFAVAALALGLYLTASFGGIWERIGDPWRAISLVLAAYFLIKSILKARRIGLPNISAARRRVEVDSDIAHRPIDTLHDTPALSENLWPAHYKNARTESKRLHHAKLRPALAPMDPYFLRFALPCVIGLSLMVGYGDNWERLRTAFAPQWTSGISAANVTYDAWVDPPEYTGRPPIYFKSDTMAAIPAGSELVARISGAKTPPRLKLRSQGRSRYVGLSRLGPKSFEARTTLKHDTRASWRIGSKSKDWALKVLQDSPPVVSFLETPKADKRDRLGFLYNFKDDYGVEQLELELKLLTDNPAEASLSERVQVTLSSRSVKEADRAPAQLDLTKHLWSGRKVSGQLVATDGLGQTARSEIAFFTVPDKIFIEPLAKAIAEQRMLVMAGNAPYAEAQPIPRKAWRNQPWFDTFEPGKRLGRAPEKVQRAALLIDSITIEPEGIYKDPAVFMGLKNVLGRMRYAREQEDLLGVPEDLWNIAIRAEFGILGTALEEMREAEQALNDGMARRAPEREIDTLFERYNTAVDRYTEYLRLKAIEDGDFAENEDGGGEGGGRNVDEIQELLDAIEEANRIGDTDGARKALKQLADLLEKMKIELAKNGGGGEGMGEGAMSEEMKEALEELADLLGEQRELKDETEQAENQSENQGEQSGQGSAQGSLQGSSQGSSGNQQGQSGESGDSQSGSKPMTPGELAEQQAALEELVEALRGGLPDEDGKPGGSGSEPGESQGGSQSGEGQAGSSGDEQTGSGMASGPEGEDGQGAGGELEDPDAALGRAGAAMAESQQRLSEGDLEGAAQAQSDAIDALRAAGRSLADQAGRRPGGEGRGENQSAEADPLGRGQDGGALDTETDADIDTRDNATKARDLMEELRRRAAEQERDQSERDYLERLMKRF